MPLLPVHGEWTWPARGARIHSQCEFAADFGFGTTMIQRAIIAALGLALFVSIVLYGPKTLRYFTHEQVADRTQVVAHTFSPGAPTCEVIGLVERSRATKESDGRGVYWHPVTGYRALEVEISTESGMSMIPRSTFWLPDGSLCFQTDALGPTRTQPPWLWDQPDPARRDAPWLSMDLTPEEWFEARESEEP